jgi:hypothetical protein
VKGRIRNELLDRGLTDILHLPVIVSVVSWHLGMDMADETVKEQTLEAIRDLLESDYAVAGQTVRDEEGIIQVRSWELPPADAIKRIDHDWSELGRLPNPGEVVWLALTDAGRAEILALRDLPQGERGIVEEVVARRRPEMGERVSLIGQGKLNWKERQAIHGALVDELRAVEQDKGDGERNEYVRDLRVLVDRALIL